jgi:hypothetical protein
MNIIHMSLSSGNTFVPVEPLRVDPLESSFEEMGYEGYISFFVYFQASCKF